MSSVAETERGGFVLADGEVDVLARLVVRGEVAEEDVVACLQRERELLREAALDCLILATRPLVTAIVPFTGSLLADVFVLSTRNSWLSWPAFLTTNVTLPAFTLAGFGAKPHSFIGTVTVPEL